MIVPNKIKYIPAVILLILNSFMDSGNLQLKISDRRDTQLFYHDYNDMLLNWISSSSFFLYHCPPTFGVPIDYVDLRNDQFIELAYVGNPNKNFALIFNEVITEMNLKVIEGHSIQSIKIIGIDSKIVSENNLESGGSKSDSEYYYFKNMRLSRILIPLKGNEDIHFSKIENKYRSLRINELRIAKDNLNIYKLSEFLNMNGINNIIETRKSTIITEMN